MGQKKREACGWTGDAARARKSCSYYPSAAILIALETNTDTLQHREEILTHTDTHTWRARTLSRKCAFDKPKRLPHAPRAVKGMIWLGGRGCSRGQWRRQGVALHIDLTMIYVTILPVGLHVCVTHVRLEKNKNTPSEEEHKTPKELRSPFLFSSGFHSHIFNSAWLTRHNCTHEAHSQTCCPTCT